MCVVSREHPTQVGASLKEVLLLGFSLGPREGRSYVYSQPQAFVSEGLSPSADGGACLRLTRREAERPPAAPGVFHLRDSGLRTSSVSQFGLPVSHPSRLPLSPRPGRVGAEHMFG